MRIPREPMYTFIKNAGFVAACAAAAGILYIAIFGFGTPPLSEALEEVSACFERRDPEDKADIPCLRAALQGLLDTHPTRAIMQGLTSAESPETVARNCHLIGHILGGYTYERAASSEDALEQCTSACRSACSHGVVGATILNELGETYPDDDIAHADLPTIETLGARYCDRSIRLCHSIGHILFITSRDYEASLKSCDTLADSPYKERMCYEGVFMEGSGEAESLWLTESPQSIEVPEYGYPCSTISQKYQRACFRYLIRFNSALFAKDNITDPQEQTDITRKTCESLEGSARSDCMYGIGRYAYRLRNTAGVLVRLPTFCNQFLPNDQDPCMLGIVHSYLGAVPPRYADAMRYCVSLEEDRKPLCYSAAFQMAERSLPLSDDDAGGIELCPPNAPAECAARLAEYRQVEDTLPEYFLGLPSTRTH